MKTIHITLGDEAHQKLATIKKFLGASNLNEVIEELIRRFNVGDKNE